MCVLNYIVMSSHKINYSLIQFYQQIGRDPTTLCPSAPQQPAAEWPDGKETEPAVCGRLIPQLVSQRGAASIQQILSQVPPEQPIIAIQGQSGGGVCLRRGSRMHGGYVCGLLRRNVED